MGIIGSYQGYADSPLYLFKSGVWSNLQTTGTSMTYCYPPLEKHTIDTFSGESLIGILVDTAGHRENMSGVALVRLNQTVNLTPYNYIKLTRVAVVTQFGGTTGFVGVSTNANLTSDSFTARVNTQQVSTSATNSSERIDLDTLILDISNVSGEYYIYIGFSHYKYNANYANTYGRIHASSLYLTTV